MCATRKMAGRKQEEIAIDLMGPLPESEDGNKYVLVVVDSFS